MAIQGSLEEAALPDVLQLLSLGKKTGCLALTEREMQGEICLDNGMVCHAAVFSRRDRLGDMLVRTGRITQQQLDDAIAAEQHEGRHVSQTLLASGQVERAELERFVHAQVEEAVYFMFTWRSGSFAFTSSVRPKRQEFLVAIDPESLLLEGARRVDEWSLIEKKIPSLDLVFRLDQTRLDGASTLTPEQQQIIPLVDGTRDIHGIIELSGMAEFDVGKALYGLITAGFATLVERRAAMRHLDYRELLAYVVREADFAEPERRRAAARHIADCATCTQRLKTIHVRRTGAIPALSTPTERRAAEAVTDAITETTATTPTLAPGGVERRASDRRMRDERRVEERRRGEERRKSRSLEWEQPGRDRRSGSDRRAEGRRISERRLAAVGRESAAIVAARPLILPQRSRGGERRVTGPRRIRPPGDQTAPAQPKRDTGDGIRLRPADDPPASVPGIAKPASKRSPEPPVPSDALPKAPRTAVVDSHPDSDAGTTPTAETRGRADASPPVPAEPTEVRKPAPPKKGRRKEAEVPDLPVEVAAKTEQPGEQERVPAEPAPDSLALTVEQPREPSPAGATAPPEGAHPPVVSTPEADAPPVPPQPPAKAPPSPRPVRGRPPARSTDIEWLVSPDEANHLLRTSRVGLAAPATEGETVKPKRAEERSKAKDAPSPKAQEKAKQTDSARPATTPAKAKAQAERAVDRRAPRPPTEDAPKAAGMAPALDAARSPHVAPTAPPVREVATVAADHASAHRVAVTTPARTAPVRWLPIAAAAVVLIGIGWVARPLLQTGSSTATAPPPIAGQDAAPAPTAAPVDAAPEEPTTPPAAEVESPPQAPVRAAAPARPVAREAAPPPARQATPAVVPPPAVATISGTVRDRASGAALAGVRVTIPGTAFSATTDASGNYTFRDVPAGRITLAAAADGHLPGTQDVVLRSGEPAQVDFGLTLPAPVPEPAPPQAATPTADPAPTTAPPTPVAAREPDAELESGSWTLTDAATASARLRNTIATIPELWVESIAITETGSRPRARVALLTPAGERIVLTETRSGAPVIGGTPRVTALRIIPGSDAYPVTTGTASFGTLLVTAKTTLDAETLRSLLTKLAELE